jgi:S-formylglutathione hydrolase FrmB
MRPRIFAVLFLFALGAMTGPLSAAQLDILDIPGTTLIGNPLGDPTERRVAVYKPDGVKDRVRLPLVLYLPGWGDSSEVAIAQGKNAWFNVVINKLAGTTPVRIAVVNCRSRYGGSQYLNSTATGRYADYVADEILPALLARYAAPKENPATIIAGHSSGGYGALLLAITHHEKFAAVVALSPDADFAITHKARLEDTNVQAVTRAELDAAMAPPGQAQMPASATAQLIMGLCANYAPTAGQPGHFEWLYDDSGQWRADAWQRWLDLDPLVIVRGRQDAFAPTQRIYLDGPRHDEFGANVGTHKVYNVLKTRSSPTHFEEPPGSHAEQLPERLAQGLAWVLQARK